jgi:hypothetical protein
MAAEFQDRLLDELMPLKMKIKEEPPVVEDVAPAAGLKAAARLPAVRTTAPAVVKAGALSGDAPDWRGTCAVCLEGLPLGASSRQFFECCCQKICAACGEKCQEYDKRCPLCRTPAATEAESVRRLQKHVDKGNAEAQFCLGQAYDFGAFGLKKSFKRASQLYELAAAHGHAIAQYNLGVCYYSGQGVKINYKTAALWYRRAAEQGYPSGQCGLGNIFLEGKGVAQSHDEAVKWFRLAAAQGNEDALCKLGAYYEDGQDLDEALRFYKRAAAKGFPVAVAKVAEIEAWLAARPR